MNALVFDGQLRCERGHPIPRPPANESLVRVIRAGICNTDLEIVKGYMGFRGILGHEFVGSRCGPFGPALRLLEKRLMDAGAMLCAEFPLERGLEAFELARREGTLKVQIVMGQNTL